ncbi:MAG TPA: hypothetical protein VFU32_03120 [Ktedonobacterales bacterium]|nr:hypothetical protein [Ktedonobacterales bacterium]
MSRSKQQHHQQVKTPIQHPKEQRVDAPSQRHPPGNLLKTIITWYERNLLFFKTLALLGTAVVGYLVWKIPTGRWSILLTDTLVVLVTLAAVSALNGAISHWKTLLQQKDLLRRGLVDMGLSSFMLGILSLSLGILIHQSDKDNLLNATLAEVGGGISVSAVALLVLIPILYPKGKVSNRQEKQVASSIQDLSASELSGPALPPQPPVEQTPDNNGQTFSHSQQSLAKHQEDSERMASQQPTPPASPFVARGFLFYDDPLYSLPSAKRILNFSGGTGSVRFFLKAKGEEPSIKSEDTGAISKDGRHLALCDGLAGSNLSRSWAASLAQYWVENPLLDTGEKRLDEWLKQPKETWKTWVRETWLSTINARNSALSEAPLPADYADEVIHGGSASTFLGIELWTHDADEGLYWESWAIGDSCLYAFHWESALQQWQCTSQFPCESREDFTNKPGFISSRNTSARKPRPHLRKSSTNNRSYPGDIIIMATDALALWLCMQIEEQRPEWQELLSLQEEDQFDEWVRHQRASGELKNDDTSLILIALQDQSSWIEGPTEGKRSSDRDVKHDHF